MYNPWVDATVLAMRSCGVIYLRTLKMAVGDDDAHAESHLMVSEKVLAHAGAAWTLMTGGTLQTVMADYLAVVEANTRRLLT